MTEDFIHISGYIWPLVIKMNKSVLISALSAIWSFLFVSHAWNWLCNGLENRGVARHLLPVVAAVCWYRLSKPSSAPTPIFRGYRPS